MNQLTVNTARCAGCGRCQERCGPKAVIRVGEMGKASFKEDRGHDLMLLLKLFAGPTLAALIIAGMRRRGGRGRACGTTFLVAVFH